MSKALHDFFGSDEEEEEEEDLEIISEFSEYFVEPSKLSMNKLNLSECAKQENSKIKHSHRVKKSTRQLIRQYETEPEINEKKKETVLLEKVHSRLHVQKSLKMKFNVLEFISVQIVSLNPKYIQEIKKAKEKCEKAGRYFDAHYVHNFLKTELIFELEFNSLKTIDCLRRFHHAICQIGDQIFIHGGMNSKKQLLNDLLIFNAKRQELLVLPNCLPGKYNKYNDGAINDLKIPALSNHQIVTNGTDLLIIGTPNKSKFLEFFLISNVSNFEHYNIGTVIKNQFQHFIVEESCERIFARHDFTVVHDSSFKDEKRYFYLFGGRRDLTALGDMYKITWFCRNNPYVDPIPNLICQVKGFCCPCPRYGHSAVSTGEDMYIYGGRDRYHIFNDLHVFNFETLYWKGILTTTVPSGCYYTSIVIVLDELLVYGGMTKEMDESNGLYMFNFQTSSWNRLDIQTQDSNYGELKIQIHGHASSVINGTFYTFGGCNSRDVIDNAVKIDNICDPTVYPRLLTQLRRLRFLMTDLRIITKDLNGKTRILDAHRCILAARCSYFQQLLQGKEDVREIELVDVHFEIIEIYLQYLYFGTLDIEGKEMIANMLNFLKKSNEQNFIVVQDLCSINRDSMDDVYENLMKDYKYLQNNEDLSDFKVILDCGKIFKLHKVILSQIPGFLRAFQINMKESIDNEMELSSISESSFQQIVNFIYQDECSITLQNCVTECRLKILIG